jgi:hypothetical protein
MGEDSVLQLIEDCFSQIVKDVKYVLYQNVTRKEGVLQFQAYDELGN